MTTKDTAGEKPAGNVDPMGRVFELLDKLEQATSYYRELYSSFCSEPTLRASVEAAHGRMLDLQAQLFEVQQQVLVKLFEDVSQ